MKVVIAGGVATGMSAAAKIKRIDPASEVLVFEKRNFLSYGACGIPYYIAGSSDDFRILLMRTREQIEDAGIKTFLRHRIEKVDAERKAVMVRDLDHDKAYWEFYDALLLATGAEALSLNIPGYGLGGVHSIKTLEDGIFLRELAAENRIQNVVIIGGGAIGVEIAEAFSVRQKNVRLIEAGRQILPAFDPEFAAVAQAEIERSGVAVHINEKVESFEGGSWIEKVNTNRGSYPADLAIVNIGVRPATDFLASSGVELAKNGAIVTDRTQRTSLPGIYAAGDCAQVYHRLVEKNVYITLGTLANKCGRLAGENICGRKREFGGALGSAGLKVFGLEFARSGLNEKEAILHNVEYKTVTVNVLDHAAYYPGASPLVIKILFNGTTGRLLGAHLYGEKGVALRADIFATAIHSGMSVHELGQTDLLYAPPFSTVWDAVAIAANAAKLTGSTVGIGMEK